MLNSREKTGVQTSWNTVTFVSWKQSLHTWEHQLRKKRQTFRACDACAECQIPQGYVRQEPGVGLAIKCDVHKGLRGGSPAHTATYACEKDGKSSVLIFTFMWPCILSNFFIVQPTRCTSFTNLFWYETLHVSDSSSVHRQEWIHCTLNNGIHLTGFVDSFGAGAYALAPKLSKNLYDT